MRATLALAATVSALALPAAGVAQGLELYDFPNFQGASVRVEREVANLGPGAFDNLTTSIAVDGGPWEVCDGANFTGQCAIVTDDVWDLQSLGMNNRISSLRLAQTAGQPAGPGQAPFGQPGFGQQPALVLYENTNYRGRSATYYSRADNLRFESFDDRARSAELVGEWTLCEGANLTSRCETFNSSVPDLSRFAMGGTISSVAPNAPGPGAGPGGPNFPGPGGFPPQQGDRMLAGTQAAFFPAPNITPARLTACLRGDARSCEDEVDVYCRNQQGGWREGAYYSIDYRNGALTDVLCVR